MIRCLKACIRLDYTYRLTFFITWWWRASMTLWKHCHSIKMLTFWKTNCFTHAELIGRGDRIRCISLNFFEFQICEFFIRFVLSTASFIRMMMWFCFLRRWRWLFLIDHFYNFLEIVFEISLLKNYSFSSLSSNWAFSFFRCRIDNDSWANNVWWRWILWKTLNRHGVTQLWMLRWNIWISSISILIMLAWFAWSFWRWSTWSSKLRMAFCKAK